MAATICACKKSGQTSANEVTNAKLQAAVASTGSIAVSVSSTTLTASASKKDSVYIVGCYPPKGKRDTIASSALSTNITTYLTANYSGYTFLKAFKISEANGTAVGIVVVINLTIRLWA